MHEIHILRCMRAHHLCFLPLPSLPHMLPHSLTYSLALLHIVPHSLCYFRHTCMFRSALPCHVCFICSCPLKGKFTNFHQWPCWNDQINKEQHRRIFHHVYKIPFVAPLFLHLTQWGSYRRSEVQLFKFLSMRDESPWPLMKIGELPFKEKSIAPVTLVTLVKHLRSMAPINHHLTRFVNKRKRKPTEGWKPLVREKKK